MPQIFHASPIRKPKLIDIVKGFAQKNLEQ
jgi:hypothetical protein